MRDCPALLGLGRTAMRYPNVRMSKNSDPHNFTESVSAYSDLEKRSAAEILTLINGEDQKVPKAVERVIPQLKHLVEALVPRFVQGGRLLYLGAGTSGRLGIVDASEIPPTYGLDHARVIGLIAGGDEAIRKSVEFAEDDPQGARRDLDANNLQALDTVIGIAASGRTPYTVEAVRYAASMGCLTGAITCNSRSPLAKQAAHPIEVVVGPEVVTGSTRMKSGTAQKLVLNMITTTLMILTGRVEDNKMVWMQLTNRKLNDRGERMLMERLRISRQQAREMLGKHGSVSASISAHDSSR